MSKDKLDLPQHIQNRIEELENARVQVLARLTAIEGAMMELNKLLVDITDKPEEEKKDKKERNPKARPLKEAKDAA